MKFIEREKHLVIVRIQELSKTDLLRREKNRRGHGAEMYRVMLSARGPLKFHHLQVIQGILATYQILVLAEAEALAVVLSE
jgi:hypothetical protein